MIDVEVTLEHWDGEDKPILPKLTLIGDGYDYQCDQFVWLVIHDEDNPGPDARIRVKVNDLQKAINAIVAGKD